MIWEYLIAEVSSESPEATVADLNKLGADGWELFMLNQIQDPVSRFSPTPAVRLRMLAFLKRQQPKVFTKQEIDQAVRKLEEGVTLMPPNNEHMTYEEYMTGKDTVKHGQ